MESKIMKILAIDDNQDNLISIKALINEAFPDAKIFTALTGERGLELAIAEDPDVILLDIVMPGMDGFEVCSRLKADKTLCDIPVVFVTAIKGDKESRIRALECGAEAFLAKPIDETELTAQIRAMVKIKKANVEKRDEKVRLAALVAERTEQLEQELEERKKAEKALKQSEERFQMLFNQAPLGYQSLDIEGCFIEVNQQWLDTLGFTRAEVIGKWFGDFLSPIYQDGFRKRFPIFKAQGYIHSEFEMVHKNGEKLFIAFEGKIGYDIHGEFKQTHCILQDITQSKKTEQALQVSEAKFREFFEKAADAIFIAEIESGIIVDANEAASRLMLRKHEELVGIHQTELHPQANENYATDTFTKHKELVNSKVNSHAIENSVVRADGIEVPVEILASKVDYQGMRCMMGTFRDITMRKKVEEKLRINEERLRNSLEAATDAIWDWNVTTSEMYFSPRWYEILGYQPHEIKPNSKEWVAMAHPDDKDAALKIIYESIANGLPYEIEFRTKHADGHWVWCLVKGKVTGYDASGKPTRVSGINSDITLRKQAEEALRESEEKYRLLYENTGIGIGYYKIDGTIISYNQIAAKNMNGKPEDFTGKTIYEIFPQQEAKFYHERIKQAALSDKSAIYEDMVQLPTEKKYFLSVFSKICDSENNISGIQIVSQDITERMHAEKYLIDSKQRYQTILQTAMDGYWIVNTMGQLIEVNETYCRMSGYNEQELLSMHIPDLEANELPDHVTAHIQSIMSKGEDRFESRHRRKDGTIFNVEISVQYQLIDNGLLVVFIKDITERKSIDNLLNFIAQRGWLATGKEFLPSLAEYLGQLLKVDYVIIDKLADDLAIAETVGLYANGEVVPNLSYTLAGTPCENVIGKEMCHISQNVQQQFPSDIMLVEMKAESYLGIPLWDSSGAPIGLIAVLDSKTMMNADQASSLIKLVAAAAAAELERQREEKVLRESEAQYRLLAYHMTDTVWMMDMNLITTYISPSVEKLRGYSLEEIQQLPLEKQLTPVSYQIVITAFSEEMNKILTDPTYFVSRIIELEFYRKDGTTYWSDNTFTLIRDDAGNPVSFLGEGRDITERKKAEEDLRKSEEKYRTIFENVQDVFYQTDLAGNMLEISPSIKYYTEFSRDEILGTPVTNLYYNPNDRVTIIAELMKKGEVRDFQLKLKTNTNQIKYGSINARLIFGSDGKPHHIDGAIRDVTERKLAEKQIQQLSRAIEQSTVSVVITNKEGEIEYTNPKVTELTGYNFDELKGKNPRILKSGEHPTEFYKTLWNTILSGNNWHGEFQNKKKNGELYWESVTISPIMNENGDISNFIAIKEDLTESKKFIRELITAKEKAEESDRLKTSFLANLSHEIRTPMNSIMGFASLLPEEESKELIANYAKIIVQNSEQLVHVIDDIVLYSRLQTKLLSFKPNKFDAQCLLADVYQSFNLPEFKMGVELKIETTIDAPLLINSDYEKLRQIFTNLISNAYKYTLQGSITIGFTIQNEKLVFFVKDTGLGIPSIELEKIFERFYRGSNVNKGVIGGTGLGLSIVKELVELLEGNIWAESDSDGISGGKGSVFRFTIPIQQNPNK